MKAFIVLLFAASLSAQDLRTASIGDFKLDNGSIIHDCRIGYRTYGDRANKIIVVTTWFGGTTKGVGNSIGDGKLFDSSKYYVIAIDALADGISSSPSNTPGTFPDITIRDMVRSQHELLTRELHIDHVYAVSGLSMGGMQTFQWLASYPGFMDRAVPIAGTTKMTSYDLLLWKTELQILQSGAANPMAIIADINTIHLDTPSYIVSHTKPEATDELMRSRAESLRNLDQADYTAQLKAMIAHDTGAIASKANVLVVVSAQDQMVNPAPARDWARANGAELVTLAGDCGHLATACEEEVVRREVHRFLDR
jgi:homoserine O-acetyltransferase